MTGSRLRAVCKVFGIRLLGVMAAAILGGCGTVDITDRAAYDRYYSDSAAKLTADTSPKLVFYVPYKQFNASPHIIVDTTAVLDALKTVYGETIVFDKSSSAPYVVDVTSVEEWIGDGLKAKSRLVADFTAYGRSSELVAEYERPGLRVSVDHPYELYRAAALELANKIKSLAPKPR